jgi:hypothetical protein
MDDMITDDISFKGMALAGANIIRDGCFRSKLTSGILAAKAGVDATKADALISEEWPKSDSDWFLLNGKEWERLVTAVASVEDWIEMAKAFTSKISSGAHGETLSLPEPVYGRASSYEPTHEADLWIKKLLKTANTFYLTASKTRMEGKKDEISESGRDRSTGDRIS